MNSGNDILDELRSMNSFLADIPRTMPYTVPDNYFDRVHENVKQAINGLNEADEAGGWGKQLPYSVPAGYFDGLNEQIMAGIKADEFLNKQPIPIPYKVPAGYFASFPEQALQAAKAGDPQKAKTIPLGKRSTWRSVRWAAAAILILGIGLGSYRIFINMPQGPAAPEQILSAVPNNEIQDYLQHTYRLDVTRVVNDNTVKDMPVDNKDIIQYLNETGWD